MTEVPTAPVTQVPTAPLTGPLTQVSTALLTASLVGLLVVLLRRLLTGLPLNVSLLRQLLLARWPLPCELAAHGAVCGLVRKGMPWH